MTYIEFKNKYQNIPIINLASLKGTVKNPESLESNINKWVKKGYIHRLKNNFYVLNDNDRKVGLSRMFISNNIYAPSYISLEYALFYYGFIPETVFELTAVSLAKTARFENYYGFFSYSKIKHELFFGFLNIKDENNMTVFIAEPEKSILDFIYLRFCKRKKTGDIIEFLNKNRIQNIDKLDKNKYKRFAKKYPKSEMENFCVIFERNKR